jgi:hypothetical protein
MVYTPVTLLTHHILLLSFYEGIPEMTSEKDVVTVVTFLDREEY